MNKKLSIIYLLGHSRSGSTIFCMYLGRLNSLFYSGELKKFNISFLERTCTCGEAAKDCKFWGPFIQQEEAYFNKKIPNDNSLVLFVKNMKSLILGNDKKTINKERNFVTNLLAHVKENLPNEDYLIDSSKSLNRLILYREMENIDLYTIYLERDLRANIASFVKRGSGVLNSYLRLKINGVIMKRYLSSNKVNHINIKYEDFINNPDSTIEKVLVKFDLKTRNQLKIENEKVHLISGNEKTRFRTTTGNYKLDKSSNLQDPFTNSQKKILRVLGL